MSCNDKEKGTMETCWIMPWDVTWNYLGEWNHLIRCVERLWHAANRFIPGVLVWCDVLEAAGAVQFQLLLSVLSWHIIHIMCKTWLKIIRFVCWCVFVSPLLLLRAGMFQGHTVDFSTHHPCTLPAFPRWTPRFLVGVYVHIKCYNELEPANRLNYSF